jgi:hypothetical protein
VLSSFGAASQRHPAGDLDSVAFGRLRTRSECSIASRWQHRETNHGRFFRRLRSCGSVEMKGAGRVSADARRATVRCLQQVFGSAVGGVQVRHPPSAWRPFAESPEHASRQRGLRRHPASVQIIRRTGGNVGNVIRGFAAVRAYAHVETDTSLTLSLYARARAWKEGVGEGHFVGARSSSEDRGVQRSRASRT